jgi:hypothetical protein
VASQGRPERRLVDVQQWPQIEEKIRSPEKSGVIARWIQSDLGLYKDIQAESLGRMIRRERERLGIGQTHAEQEVAKSKIRELQEELDKVRASNLPEVKKEKRYLNVFEEVCKLYELQLERVQIGHKIEKQMGYIVPQVTPNVSELRDILKFAYEIQQESGMGREPTEQEAPKELNRLTFEQRRVVLQAIDKVKEYVKQKEIEDQRVRKASEETVIDAVVSEPSVDKDLPF